jgi:hypothetical protein
MPFKPSPNGITIFHQYLYMIISFLFQTFERVFIIWILSIHQLLSEVTHWYVFVLFCYLLSNPSHMMIYHYYSSLS